MVLWISASLGLVVYRLLRAAFRCPMSYDERMQALSFGLLVQTTPINLENLGIRMVVFHRRSQIQIRNLQMVYVRFR